MKYSNCRIMCIATFSLVEKMYMSVGVVYIICTCVCLFICVIYIYVCIHVYICRCICVCVHESAYVHVCMCTHVYVNIYTLSASSVLMKPAPPQGTGRLKTLSCATERRWCCSSGSHTGARTALQPRAAGVAPLAPVHQPSEPLWKNSPEEAPEEGHVYEGCKEAEVEERGGVHTAGRREVGQSEPH